MRFRGALWRVAVILAWLGALVGLEAVSSSDATPYVAAGVAITVGTGALLDRWWVLAVPLVAGVAFFVPSYLAHPGCWSCGEDGDGWALVAGLTLILFVVPATVALGLGLAARRIGRFFRRMDVS